MFWSGGSVSSPIDEDRRQGSERGGWALGAGGNPNAPPPPPLNPPAPPLPHNDPPPPVASRVLMGPHLRRVRGARPPLLAVAPALWRPVRGCFPAFLPLMRCALCPARARPRASTSWWPRPCRAKRTAH